MTPGHVLIAVGLLLIPASLPAQTPPLSLLLAVRSEPRAVRLTLAGSPGQHYRIDVSTNLADWTPLALLVGGPEAPEFLDPEAVGLPRRFYRARRVEQQTEILALDRGNGLPGSRVEIRGQFFDAGRPGDNVVVFGGARASILEAGDTRLVVLVPGDAATGPVSVTTPLGSATSEEIFTVIRPVAVRLEAPAGSTASDFEVLNALGGLDPSAGGAVLGTIPVRDGLPTVTMAVPRDTTRRTLLYAVSLSAAEPVVLDPTSTAHALIFLNPFLSTSDPQIAARLLEVIRGDARVEALAGLVAQLYPRGGRPLENPAFVQAYGEAVLSVGRSPRLAALAQERRSAAAPRLAAAPSTGLASLDLRFLEGRFVAEKGVLRLADDSVFDAKVPFNPTDWIVWLNEVDVEKAFPNGIRDFRAELLADSTDRLPVAYPLRGDFRRSLPVPAKLLTERLNPLKFLLSQLFEAVSPESADTVDFGDRDAIYVLRGIGPALVPSRELDFVVDRYRGTYSEVLAINLTSAALDALGAVIDVRAALGRGAGTHLVQNLVAEALKRDTTLRTADDVATAVIELFEFAVIELNAELAESTLEGLVDRKLAAAAADQGKLALSALPIYRVLDLASSVGQVAERITGFFRISALETAFVVVGDPWQLDVVSVDPPGGSPGDTLLVTIDRARFVIGEPRDRVFFADGAATMDAQVVSARVLADGQQALTVRVPVELAARKDGDYELWVLASGRKGHTTFRVVSAPTVTAMTPSEGFAAVADFDGSPFPGTRVLLTGFGFNSLDRFFFANGIEASGGTGLTVPAGAVSGPIIIRRVSGTEVREGRSPEFTVLGPPIIDAAWPLSGPVGTTVTLIVRNLLSRSQDPAAVRVRFTGKVPALRPLEPRFPGEQIQVTVPVGAESGPVQVLTPAGQAWVDFTVEPGRAPGSVIQVGGASPVSLPRALAFAIGTEWPNDDDAFGAGQDDPPYEEGDFVIPDFGPAANPRWKVGAAYADVIEISGEIEGDLTIGDEFAFDTLRGGSIKGTVTITGHNLSIDGLRVRGSSGNCVVVLGSNNRITVFAEDCQGDGVVLDGGRNNTLTVTAGGNQGCGLTLTNGASGNRIGYASLTDPPGTIKGNRSHGVRLVGDVHGNYVQTRSSENDRDGVRLDGPAVIRNRIVVDNSGNGGNGLTLMNGASDNTVEGVASRNRGSGFALLPGGGAMPRRNLMGQEVGLSSGVDAFGNAEYGVLISGIRDQPGATRVRAGGGANGRAGLRLDDGSSGLALTALFRGGPLGFEMAGSDVTDNTGSAWVEDATGDGIVLQGARRNRLLLTARNCRGTGIILRGAVDNDLTVQAPANQGDGLLVTDGSEGNRVVSSPNVGFRLERNRNGLVVEGGARRNLFEDVRVSGNRGHGVLLQGQGTDHNRLLRVNGWIILSNALDGIRIQAGASFNQVGNDGAPGLSILKNGEAGVRVRGAGTAGNVILGCTISPTAGGPPQAVGIIVEDQAERTLIGGFADDERNLISLSRSGIIVRNGAWGTIIQHNILSAHPDFAVLVDDAPGTLVGGDANGRNQISSSGVGVQFQGPKTRDGRVSGNAIFGNTTGIVVRDGATQNLLGTDNAITSNQTGVSILGAGHNRIARNRITGNAREGILLGEGATDNVVFDNTISRNAEGVRIAEPATLRNTLNCNSITANAGKGIALVNGGNRDLPPPVILDFSSRSVLGTASAPDRSVVEIFTDPADEGESGCIGGGLVVNGRFEVLVDLSPAQVGSRFELTATVTDPEGNTSEFGTRVKPFPGRLSQIVFTSTRDGNQELYLLDGPLSVATRLTDNPAADHSPALSADARRIAFVSTRDGNPEIYTMALLAGAAAVRCTTNAVPDLDPAWSPDGRKLAFVSERDGNPEIHVMNANGTGAIRLTTDAATDRTPAFSPDGRSIAFASNRTGNFEIFVMNADGSDPHPVTAHPAPDLRPAWSPDGALIVFVSERDGNPEIHSVRPDGTQLVRHTDHPAMDSDPAWLVGGDGLVFASARDEGFELYLLRLPGGTMTRLTVSAGDNTQPTLGRR